jgi:hypothetical protein
LRERVVAGIDEQHNLLEQRDGDNDAENEPPPKNTAIGCRRVGKRGG